MKSSFFEKLIFKITYESKIFKIFLWVVVALFLCLYSYVFTVAGYEYGKEFNEIGIFGIVITILIAVFVILVAACNPFINWIFADEKIFRFLAVWAIGSAIVGYVFGLMG